VIQATGEYFVQQDLFGEWLEETCDVDPDNRYLISRSADLFGSWKAYATTAGEQPGSRITFAESLTAMGLERDRGTDGSRAYRGIALKRPPQSNDGV
jgi:putative DNA primase/helicase